MGPAELRGERSRSAARHGVVVGHGVDVDPAVPPRPPVAPAVAEHERGVGHHRHVPLLGLHRQGHGARRHTQAEVDEALGAPRPQARHDGRDVLGQRRDRRPRR